MTNSPQTISALLENGADDATALSSPGGIPLTYGALRTLVAEIVPTKLPHYVLPAYPALTVLMALWISSEVTLKRERLLAIGSTPTRI